MLGRWDEVRKVVGSVVYLDVARLFLGEYDFECLVCVVGVTSCSWWGDGRENVPPGSEQMQMPGK